MCAATPTLNSPSPARFEPTVWRRQNGAEQSQPARLPIWFLTFSVKSSLLPLAIGGNSTREGEGVGQLRAGSDKDVPSWRGCRGWEPVRRRLRRAVGRDRSDVGVRGHPKNSQRAASLRLVCAPAGGQVQAAEFDWVPRLGGEQTRGRLLDCLGEELTGCPRRLRPRLRYMGRVVGEAQRGQGSRTAPRSLTSPSFPGTGVPAAHSATYHTQRARCSGASRATPAPPRPRARHARVRAAQELRASPRHRTEPAASAVP